MKSLFVIATLAIISVCGLSAGETAKPAKAGETGCAASSCCQKECPKAAAALRQTLLTHKGSKTLALR